MTEEIFKLLKNPVFTSLLGVVIGSVASIITTCLNNRNQRKITELDLRYRYKLNIISDFLINLVEIRHSLENLVSDQDLDPFIEYQFCGKQLLQFKQQLIRIMFSQENIYKHTKNDLFDLLNSVNYLLDVRNYYIGSLENINDISKDVFNKMEQIIDTAKKIERKIIEGHGL